MPFEREHEFYEPCAILVLSGRKTVFDRRGALECAAGSLLAVLHYLDSSADEKLVAREPRLAAYALGATSLTGSLPFATKNSTATTPT